MIEDRSALSEGSVAIGVIVDVGVNDGGVGGTCRIINTRKNPGKRSTCHCHILKRKCNCLWNNSSGKASRNHIVQRDSLVNFGRS